ncbi:hypothetical protein JOQ06_005121, partial [Pogonophryne albipinna]
MVVLRERRRVRGHVTGSRESWPGTAPPPAASHWSVPDLVKSHLMLAVREEVELLKDQIRDLRERNQNLERENLLLRTLTHTQSAHSAHSTWTRIQEPGPVSRHLDPYPGTWTRIQEPGP